MCGGRAPFEGFFSATLHTLILVDLAHSASFYFAACEKGVKLYWSSKWFRLDETFGLNPPLQRCHPPTPAIKQVRTKVNHPHKKCPPPLCGGAWRRMRAAKYLGLCDQMSKLSSCVTTQCNVLETLHTTDTVCSVMVNRYKKHFYLGRQKLFAASFTTKRHQQFGPKQCVGS